VSEYKIEDHQLFILKHTREGQVVPKLLCNFDARIVREDIEDDGVERKTVFIISGTRVGGAKLPDVRVPAEKFSGLNWVVEGWGTRARLCAGVGNRDHIRAAIQEVSGDPPQETTFTHIGWRRLNEGFAYLHGGGAISVEGNDPSVRVDPGPGKLRYYELPPPPTGDDLIRGIHASINITKLGNSKSLFPILAAVYRSPLSDLVATDYAIFIAGPTGVFKTQIAALAQAHFGARFSGLTLPGNWSSTENALEREAFLLKDTLFCVDDFAPYGTSYEVSALHRKAERLIRAQGNLGGRARCNAEGKIRSEYFPRGLILATGEDLPRGHSIRARLLVLEIEKGGINPTKLSTAQNDAEYGLFAGAMAGYLQWLSPRLETMKKGFLERQTELRDGFASANLHRRTASILGSLAAGFEVFLAFAREVGAIDEQRRNELHHAAFSQLLGAAELQFQHQATEDVVNVFLTKLSAAISSGKVHLANAHCGDSPVESEKWGWRDGRGNGTCVGWVGEDGIYLDPEAAYSEVQKLASSQNENVVVSQRTLWKRMTEKGIAQRDSSDGRNLVKRTLPHGRRAYVLHLPNPDSLIDSATIEAIDPSEPQSGPKASIASISGDGGAYV